MKITDINTAYNVTISPRSITVKNPETDKTAGVIRGVGSWTAVPDRVLFTAHENLRKVINGDTLPVRKALNHVAAVIEDGHFIFIISKHSVDFCEKYEPTANYLKAVNTIKSYGLTTVIANKVKAC